MNYKRRTSDHEQRESEFTSCPRYDKHELSADQIEQIVEKAAKRGVEMARQDFYKGVGESVVSKWFIFIGMATVAFYAWARSKNIL